jgi:hypothetical protein
MSVGSASETRHTGAAASNVDTVYSHRPSPEIAMPLVSRISANRRGEPGSSAGTCVMAPSSPTSRLV